MITPYNFNYNQDAAFIQSQLKQTDQDYQKALSAVGSGLAIESAQDEPTDFVISENTKTQIGGVRQSIKNIDSNVNFMQTVDAFLGEYQTTLLDLKKLAIQAANEAVNNEVKVETMQTELEIILDRLHSIAKNGVELKQGVFTGSGSVIGEFENNNIVFIGAEASVNSSPKEGYEVIISQLPSQASRTATVELTPDLIEAGEDIFLSVDGKSLTYTTDPTDDFGQVVANLNLLLKQNEMPLYFLDDELTIENELLRVFHTEYGSDHHFMVSSSTAGVLSTKELEIIASNPGDDVAGTIDGVQFRGQGKKIFTDNIDSHIMGLELFYNSDVDGNQSKLTRDFNAGNLLIKNHALKFHNRENYGKSTALALLDLRPDALAQDVENNVGFDNLGEINFENFENANASIALIDKAINEITILRGKVGSTQKNQLEMSRHAQDKKLTNIIQVHSAIADTNMAEAISALTNNTIQRDVSTSLLAQANQNPSSVLTLLN